MFEPSYKTRRRISEGYATRAERKAFGRWGQERGRSHEAAAIRILNYLPIPDWIISARAANEFEDKQRGIDIVVFAKGGFELYLQIKSSKVEAKKYRRKHGYSVGCVIGCFQNDVFRQRLINMLFLLWHQAWGAI